MRELSLTEILKEIEKRKEYLIAEQSKGERDRNVKMLRDLLDAMILQGQESGGDLG